LNEKGTLIAVMWAEAATRKARANTVETILAKKASVRKELAGAERTQALQSFRTGAGWYRGGAVDKLSEEEARLIAARLVRRVQAKVPLSEEKAAALQAGLADTFKRRFTRPSAESGRAPREQQKDEVLKVGREHLDEQGLAALQEALAAGVRPRPNEK
jgi:hypothetical protein